jgi:riboflavin kinase/FMN adenylyltransferase
LAKEAQGIVLKISQPSQLPQDFAETVVTIGKFDGIHLGHQKLLASVQEAADEQMLASVVLTFDRHPDQLLAPERAKLPLIGPSQKQQLIEDFGTDVLLTMPFDQELASKSPEQFVKDVLVDGLHAQWVLVGEDFRFGARGAGDVDTLKTLGQQFGFVVRVVSSVEIDGQKVSSSLIRDLLDQGAVAQVAKLLGRPHTSVGLIEHGLKIGRSIGFPTANMTRDCEGYLPLDGVYAGWLCVDGERYPAAHSVGINETFKAVPRLVESHVIDRTDLDLYDRVVTLEFIEFIRPAAKFDGVESLVAEINRDLEKCRVILAI